MKLLTMDLRAALLANAAAHAVEDRRHDPVPVVRFFNPCGAATWLATELDPDGDTLFGLADLGFGCPELGYFSLSEIEAVRVPFGLRIERDIGFATTAPLSVWADAARRAGSILGAQAGLRDCERVAPPTPPVPGSRGNAPRGDTPSTDPHPLPPGDPLDG